MKSKRAEVVGTRSKKSIRMMQSMLLVDIVAQLHDTPVVGLFWGALFDLAPEVR